MCRSVTDIANACLQCVVDTILYTRVEWFSIFFEFWKPTHFCRSGIYSGTQFQKIGDFGRAHAWRSQDKVFIFKKSVTLKFNTFFWKLVDTFLIHQRTIYKKKINFYFPQMDKPVFDLYKVKFFFFFFTSFSALKENQRIRSPLSQASKMF